MIRYLPALGEHEPTNGYGTGIEGAAIGVTNGLRTSWDDVRKIMRGAKDEVFKTTWFKDIVLRPAKSSICLFDSGLYSVFGLAKKNPSMDFAKFFDSYAPAYCEYINYVLKSVPKESGEHCFFVNLDTDFLLGLDRTRAFNDYLLKKVPEGRMVGTYHAADGKAYLDELIEKFDYIAVADSQKGVSFIDDAVALNYVQAACEYARNKKPSIKIHVLGRTDESLFEKVADLADTCDSSSYRFFGEPTKLFGTNLWLSDFWQGGFNYAFCGGIEKARTASVRPFSDMQYSALIVETLQLYSTLALASKYSRQVVRSNCPVRDAVDEMFGIDHSWWDASGGPGARYLAWKESTKFLKGKMRKVRDFEFLTEAAEGAIDFGATASEMTNKRKNDWTRQAPRPENF